jgi:hypothetical protein
VAKISRTLRQKRPDLGEDAGDGASAAYLAASFIAYASEKTPQSAAHWCRVWGEVLEDAAMTLDDDDNEEAIRSVVKDLIDKGVLCTPQPQIEKGSLVQALLAVDDEWHEAVVDQALGDSTFRVIFLQYGSPQDTPAANIRMQESIVDDEGAEDAMQEGECEMCSRQLLLTFHHLIPKDTHPTYLKKRLPVGIEGEPTRGFLNTYGTIVCRQCHSYIHRLASNDVLAREYNTLEKILEHPLVQRWVEWAGKQRSGR